MARRACAATKPNGTPCQAPPLTDGDFCLMHAPDHAAEVAEARRLGGLRRRREHTVAGAYQIGDVRTVAGLRRVLEVAMLDTLGLDNSIARARARTLGYLVGAGVKLLEVGELEDRVLALEAAVRGGSRAGRSAREEPPPAIAFVEAAS